MNATATAEDLRNIMIEDGNAPADVDFIIDVLQKSDDFADQLPAYIAQYAGNIAEKDALRARLKNDPALRQAICPNTDWQTPYRRFEAASTILRWIEQAVERAHEQGKPGYEGVTVDTIAAQLIVDKSTAQDTIDMLTGNEHHDPAVFGWGWMTARIRDAVAAITQDARFAAHQKRIAEEDARWAAFGQVRCDRCGGAGGHHGWPGYTCFKCGGERHVPA